MKELTEQELFEYIAPYLPYKLMVFDYDDGPIHAVNIKDYCGHIDIITEEFSGSITHLKPILRPMSDLIKPLGDAQIIPIIEIGEILRYKELEISDSNGKMECVYELECGHDNYRYRFDWDKERKSFNSWIIEDKESFPMIGMELNLDALKLLYKWHFDVHDLIGMGYAIDINRTKQAGDE